MLKNLNLLIGVSFLLMVTSTHAVACMGPWSETYILITSNQAVVPKGTIVLQVTVRQRDLKLNARHNSDLSATVIRGLDEGKTVRILPPLSSCSWWAAETRLFYGGKVGGPYFVVGYPYRDAKGQLIISPVEYGLGGRVSDHSEWQKIDSSWRPIVVAGR